MFFGLHSMENGPKTLVGWGIEAKAGTQMTN